MYNLHICVTFIFIVYTLGMRPYAPINGLKINEKKINLKHVFFVAQTKKLQFMVVKMWMDFVFCFDSDSSVRGFKLLLVLLMCNMDLNGILQPIEEHPHGSS